VRVVAGVVQYEGLLLVCRRSEQKSLAGLWEFPGGKVELGESDREALIRELQEELGIQVEVGDLICKSESDESGTEIEMFTYFCLLRSLPPTMSSDHDKLIWVTRTELKSLEWPALDIPVVQVLTNSH
jgi:8-oxo-dGTP diphosphatase